MKRPAHYWEKEGKPTEAPQRVFQQIARSSGVAEAVSGPIAEGGRHRTLVSLAGTMRRRGMTGEEIVASLTVANKTRCEPPLPEAEVVELAHDVARRYEPDKAQQALEGRAETLLATGRAEGSPEAPVSRRERAKRVLLRRPLSQVKAAKVEWLVPKFVPLGTLTLVAGVGGLGKSALALAWAARISNQGVTTLLVSYEDEASRVIKPRFEAAGGDLDRLHELYVDPTDGMVVLPSDMDELSRHISETTARLLVIDPVAASIDLKLDAHRDQDVRVVLGQLAKMAEAQQIAQLQVAHLNKAPSVDPYMRINGSTGFYNASRSVVTVTRDPQDPDWLRLVAQHKMNYGQLAEVERWQVVPTTVHVDGLEIETMMLEFVEIADDVDRDNVLSPARGNKGLETKAWLIDALLDGEWHPSADIKAWGERSNHPVRSVERAFKSGEEAGDFERKSEGFPRHTYWRLSPTVAAEYVDEQGEWPDDPEEHLPGVFGDS